jgi:hypothetical protein
MRSFDEAVQRIKDGSITNVTYVPETARLEDAVEGRD